jgi:hypothetical protein
VKLGDYPVDSWLMSGRPIFAIYTICLASAALPTHHCMRVKAVWPDLFFSRLVPWRPLFARAGCIQSTRASSPSMAWKPSQCYHTRPGSTSRIGFPSWRRPSIPVQRVRTPPSSACVCEACWRFTLPAPSPRTRIRRCGATLNSERDAGLTCGTLRLPSSCCVLGGHGPLIDQRPSPRRRAHLPSQYGVLVSVASQVGTGRGGVPTRPLWFMHARWMFVISLFYGAFTDGLLALASGWCVKPSGSLTGQWLSTTSLLLRFQHAPTTPFWPPIQGPLAVSIWHAAFTWAYRPYFWLKGGFGTHTESAKEVMESASARTMSGL